MADTILRASIIIIIIECHLYENDIRLVHIRIYIAERWSVVIRIVSLTLVGHYK